jgi:hypothetical protein
MAAACVLNQKKGAATNPATHVGSTPSSQDMLSIAVSSCRPSCQHSVAPRESVFLALAPAARRAAAAAAGLFDTLSLCFCCLHGLLRTRSQPACVCVCVFASSKSVCVCCCCQVVVVVVVCRWCVCGVTWAYATTNTPASAKKYVMWCAWLELHLPTHRLC